LHSDRGINVSATWESRKIVRSELQPDVEYDVARMSFGRRLELMKRIRDLAARIEFFEAGQAESNRMEASLLAGEMDRVFLEWGLQGVSGLEIDGAPASVAALIGNGPEDLVHEALGIVKAECGLNEAERKN
jgi:hypothetical protein